MQYNATHRNTPTEAWPVSYASNASSTPQHTAIHCNTLQHSYKGMDKTVLMKGIEHTATYCNTATHYTTPQHTYKGINREVLFRSIEHTATYCNTTTPQHFAIHCNTLQHTATHRNTPIEA